MRATLHGKSGVLREAPNTSKEIVDLLYRAVLRRPPDPEGWIAYSHLLEAGTTELELIRLLTSSEEFTGSTLVPGKPSVRAVDEYDAETDPAIAKYRTAEVGQFIERLHHRTLDAADFERASINAIEEPGEFATSQEEYFRFHHDRFYEIDNALANLLKMKGGASFILDFGLSINSFMIRRLFPTARIGVADRPAIQPPAGKFDAGYSVDLLDDHLQEKDLGARFDIIVFSEVVEHVLVHPVNVIKFLLKHLAPDGYVLLTTPNLFSRGKMRLISERKNPLLAYPIDYTQADAPHFHVREYCMSEMLSMVEAAGGRNVAFSFSGCWDPPATRDQMPAHELGNLFILFQRNDAPGR